MQAHGLIQQRISSLEKYSLEATVTSNTHDARIEMLESTVRTLANEVQVASAAIITLSENVPGGAQPPRPPLSTGADAEDIKIQVTHDLACACAARARAYILTHSHTTAPTQLSAMQGQIAALQQAARQQEEQIEFLQRSMSELLDGKMAAQHPFVECSQAEETKEGEEENREEEEGEDNTIEGNKITAQGSSGVHFNEKPFKTIGRTAKTPKSGLGKGLTRKKLDPVVPETAEKGHQNFLKNTETTSSPDENTQEAAVTSGPVIIIPHEKCPKIGHKAHHAKKRLRKKTLEHTDSRGGSRTYLCPKREHVYEEHHDDDADHRVWVHCSENAYGSFLYLCLHDNVKSACTQSGPMLVVSWLLQCCFSWELWQALPSVNESAAFCLVPMSIQASAIMVFITLMMNNVAPMTVHATLALNTSHMRFEDDHNRVELIVLKTWQRVFGVTVVFLSEAVTWMGVIAVGIQFILVSQSVEMVMRSTVSIVFILNIDEVIFHACGSQKLKNSLAKTSFQMNDRRTKVLGVSFEKFQDFRTNMSGYWYLPFIRKEYTHAHTHTSNTTLCITLSL